MRKTPSDSDGSLIPYHRLPSGFLERLTGSGEPVEPRPAATVVLLRDGLEVLLVRRARSAGFVPGAYVFPGGRVDLMDAAPEVLARVVGLDVEAAARRLGMDPKARLPAIAYFVAAVRETFEETGILVGGRAQSASPSTRDRAIRDLRVGLLRGELSLADVAAALHLRIDLSGLTYMAHWVTPKAERRRYDTRFFAARIPPDSEAAVDGREMTDAVWLTPSEALDRHASGALPMIFPTLHTLRELASARDAGTALATMAGKDVKRILPKLVPERDGVRMLIDG